jgi:hypothetical protein
MYIRHFDSWKELGQFVWAREFYDVENHKLLSYNKTKVERLGDALVAPLLGPLDLTARRIYDPRVIVSLVIIGIAAVSLIYYPDKTVGLMKRAFPKATEIQPGTLKFTLFCWTQLTLLGLGLRTWGRQDPHGPLMIEWKQRMADTGARKIQPVLLGSTLIKV